jgi:putative ABC transport system ATP-binding protein
LEIRLAALQIQFPKMPEPLLRIRERRIRSGARLLIRGPSGAGKTTLLHVVAGLMDPQQGAAYVDGISRSRMDEGQRCRWRRLEVGVVFQRLNLLGHLTALENVMLATEGGEAARERACAALDRLGLYEIRERLAHRLSLGERQRVAVARVVAREPGLVLADEPTSSLDEFNAQRVMKALRETTDGRGTLIVTTHDTRIEHHFDEVWTLEPGALL